MGGVSYFCPFGLKPSPAEEVHCPPVRIIPVTVKVIIPVLVRVEETSANKPSDDASLELGVVKTRGEWNLWDKPAGHLVTGRVATGVKVA